jgi:hypothetical protein
VTVLQALPSRATRECWFEVSIRNGGQYAQSVLPRMTALEPDFFTRVALSPATYSETSKMTLVLSRRPVYGVVEPKLLRMGACHLCLIGSARALDLAVALGAPEAQVMPVWEKLVEEGRIARDDSGDWRPTELMHELGMARIGAMLPRKKAEALVRKIIENAGELNSLPVTAPEFYVTRLAVFGSYLDKDKDELGDLDIAWEECERPGTLDALTASVFGGPNPITATTSLLRPKGPYVRLLEMGKLLELGGPYELICSFSPSRGATAPRRRKRGDAA